MERRSSHRRSEDPNLLFPVQAWAEDSRWTSSKSSLREGMTRGEDILPVCTYKSLTGRKARVTSDMVVQFMRFSCILEMHDGARKSLWVHRRTRDWDPFHPIRSSDGPSVTRWTIRPQDYDTWKMEEQEVQGIHPTPSAGMGGINVQQYG
jgi:hypothetical protein